VSHWLRLILSVLALVGLLATAPSGVFAATPQIPATNNSAQAQSAAHECCPHANHSAPDRAKLPDCCASGLCACAQPNFEPRLTLFRLAPQPAATLAPPAPRAWRRLASLSRPPDLRPPIA
jgi:hypothetical protein